MLLAELIVRHTRRHMPTRRGSLESAYLPMSGPAHGAALLAAVMATNLPAVADEQGEHCPGLVAMLTVGLDPRIALRYRLQRDVHGLDRRVIASWARTVGSWSSSTRTARRPADARLRCSARSGSHVGRGRWRSRPCGDRSREVRRLAPM